MTYATDVTASSYLIALHVSDESGTSAICSAANGGNTGSGTCFIIGVSPGSSTTVTNPVDEGPGHFKAGVTPPTGYRDDSFHDTATIFVSGSATPTGTVTYHFFTDGTCGSADEVTTGGWPDTVTVASDGSVPNSQSTGPLAAGSYSFQAVYSGDSNYLGSTGGCEPFNVSSTPFPPPPTVPEFPLGLALLLAITIPGFLLIRSKFTGKFPVSSI